MRKYSKISNKERMKLLEELCETLSVLKTPQEIMSFLVDLLTRQELIMLAKRIKIAKLLIKGKSYRSIENLLGVGHTTVAKVSQWLIEGGEGFRLVTERTRKEEPKPLNNWDIAMKDWRKLKRRYPSMFWPQLLIEGIIKTMNKKQKDKVYQAIQKLDHKSSTYKQINQILKR